MILADKLILLRKKAGWSQEELAEQMNVTRQSVSKWEGAQSVPDLEKIIRLSELFGVSTDYLLKDEIEVEECIDTLDKTSPLRRVSMEEANAFLSAKAVTSKSIAYATFLCILSPICLLILGAMSETAKYNLSENIAGVVGMVVLLVFVALAVAMFISSGNKTAPFSYLEKEIFETEYGVGGMVKERKSQYKGVYEKNNIIGACLCIMALISFFVGAMSNEDNVLIPTIMLCISLILAGIGVVCFIQSGIIWASYEKLLQEGDYSADNKKKQSIISAISVSFWLIVVAMYLGYSFSTNNWKYSWVIWVVAGVVFPAIVRIVNLFIKQK